MMVLRLALRFTRDESAADMTHSDMLRLWEKAIRDSGLPAAASEGRSGRPRFSLVAPLPKGYTSQAEWAELYLREPCDAVSALNPLFPRGVRICDAASLFPTAPSLQSQLRWAEYRVGPGAGVARAEVESAVAGFFARARFPWEETIEGKTRRFDLRDLVDDLWLEDHAGGLMLGMRLDARSTGTGRPDSVLAGLGISDARTRHRTRLVFSYLPAALQLWRRTGRFEAPRPER